jgi:hypothetical protein
MKAGLTLGCALVGLSVIPVYAAPTATLPGLTYESLKQLPDWSGWWGFQGIESGNAGTSKDAFGSLLGPQSPLKPEALAKIKTAFSSGVNAVVDYCVPTRFVGLTTTPEAAFEFLFTPGRVTLTSESGVVRRIYTDGRSMPDTSNDETNMGTSIGHWEGSTLVVETAGLNSRAGFPFEVALMLRLGKGARITERIHLNAAGRLQFDVTIIAPELFTRPATFSGDYQHLSNYTGREVSLCSSNDRSIDPVTGQQRFDTTVPDDLPPPPAE